MQIAGFNWAEVSVSHLAVTVEGPDGTIALHSYDTDFALRLAEAIASAYARRSPSRPGRSAIPHV
jgi:hypothetical protein